MRERERERERVVFQKWTNCLIILIPTLGSSGKNTNIWSVRINWDHYHTGIHCSHVCATPTCRVIIVGDQDGEVGS